MRRMLLTDCKLFVLLSIRYFDGNLFGTWRDDATLDIFNLVERFDDCVFYGKAFLL